MKSKTVAELETILAKHSIRRCHYCEEYEEPRGPMDSVGGIQAEDFGKDCKGRSAHVRCVIVASKNKG